MFQYRQVVHAVVLRLALPGEDLGYVEVQCREGSLIPANSHLPFGRSPSNHLP